MSDARYCQCPVDHGMNRDANCRNCDKPFEEYQRFNDAPHEHQCTTIGAHGLCLCPCGAWRVPPAPVWRDESEPIPTFKMYDELDRILAQANA